MIGCRNWRPSTAAVHDTRARVAQRGNRAGDVDEVHDVPPRMNPRGLASFGRTTCTISVRESDAGLAVEDIAVATAGTTGFEPRAEARGHVRRLTGSARPLREADP